MGTKATQDSIRILNPTFINMPIRVNSTKIYQIFPRVIISIKEAIFPQLRIISWIGIEWTGLCTVRLLSLLTIRIITIHSAGFSRLAGLLAIMRDIGISLIGTIWTRGMAFISRRTKPPSMSNNKGRRHINHSLQTPTATATNSTASPPSTSKTNNPTTNPTTSTTTIPSSNKTLKTLMKPHNKKEGVKSSPSNNNYKW